MNVQHDLELQRAEYRFAAKIGPLSAANAREHQLVGSPVGPPMGVLFEGYLQRRWSEHSLIEEKFFALEGAEGRNVFLVLYPRAPVNGEDDCTVPEQALSLAGSWITPASDAIDPQCKRVKLFGFQLCFLPATGHGVVVSRLELFADSEDEAREWVLQLVTAGARGDAELCWRWLLGGCEWVLQLVTAGAPPKPIIRRRIAQR